jgi:AraC-like DNA-binding protein
MDVQPHLLNLSAYINQNLEKDLPLSSLAKRVALSPFHFHRKFGAYFGESLHQHIKRLRLERAAYALLHGTTPVRQIAHDSGYKTVSAFSHAFSGFAGESPTRYRSAGVDRAGTINGNASKSAPQAAWIGHVDPLTMAFVRATGRLQGAEPIIRGAIEQVRALAGPPAVSKESAGAVESEEFGEVIVATSDVYRVYKNEDIRMDVGLEAEQVAADRRGLLGAQTLAGGRYARFDLHCTPAEAVERCAAAALHGLRHTADVPRLTQYFVRFKARESGDASPGLYQLFVPLAD